MRRRREPGRASPACTPPPPSPSFRGAPSPKPALIASPSGPEGLHVGCSLAPFPGRALSARFPPPRAGRPSNLKPQTSHPHRVSRMHPHRPPSRPTGSRVMRHSCAPVPTPRTTAAVRAVHPVFRGGHARRRHLGATQTVDRQRGL